MTRYLKSMELNKQNKTKKTKAGSGHMLSICVSAGWLTLYFLMNHIHNLYDFPPFLTSVQQLVQRGPVQHSSQVCYSRFVCWKERLSKGYPHIWMYNLYKAAQLVCDPVTVKNISYDSHHFHTSNKNIQSDPYMDAPVLCLPLVPPL